MSEEIIEKHAETRNLTEVVVIPAHTERVESKEFKNTKKKLRQDGNYKCWICKATENLEVHHFGAPWAMANDVDFDKLKDLLIHFDIYGYSKKLADKPIETVDDIRNVIVLCKEHHNDGRTDGVANGIHNISFPAWIMQKVKKDNVEPVPINKEALQKEMERA
jgi:hypothetical protein